MLSLIDRGITAAGDFYESEFRAIKEWPQHKYLTRPVYKFFVTKVGPVSATALSFLAADLIAHQLPSAIYCATLKAVLDASNIPKREGVEEMICFAWSPKATFAWLAFAAPIMYVKFCRKRSA